MSSDFSVVVQPVFGVLDHPTASHLSVVLLLDRRCISAKVGGEHRYRAGDLVVFVPDGAILPEWLLRKGFWNEKRGKGTLAGNRGNRVKAGPVQGAASDGILFSVNVFDGYDPERHFVLTEFMREANEQRVRNRGDADVVLLEDPKEGLDVADLLGVVEWEGVG